MSSLPMGQRKTPQRTRTPWVRTWIFIYAMTLALLDLAMASTGSIYKITNATSKELPYNDETVLTCEMTVVPDLFQWRFYPLGRENASKPDTPLDLTRTDFKILSPDTHRNEKKRSTLKVLMTDDSYAGDYQCLAHYGALVIASIPDRITLAKMSNFPPQNDSYLTIASGNTIMWKCNTPESNPPAYIDYWKDGKFVPQHPDPKRTSLIKANATRADTGTYKCKAKNAYLDGDGKESSFSLSLKVTDRAYSEMPRFWPIPARSYSVNKGEAVFIECNAVGYPVPTITWTKSGMRLSPDRFKQIPGGLYILNATAQDAGAYTCEAANRLGRIPTMIHLIYHEPPQVVQGPESKTVKEGDNVELLCTISGMPMPKIAWLLNGKTVVNDPLIEVHENHIRFKSFEKRHGGQIQCFATNIVGTTYAGGELNVFPRQVSGSGPTDPPVVHHPRNHHGTNHRKKSTKKPKPKPGSSEMIPPNKPTVSRSNDESVVVRWTVPNNSGLKITFFKVQYRELGPANSSDGVQKGRAARWKTNNSDIAPNIRSFEVTGLKPDYLYKFRIAAVYSNNDNKLSQKSDRFHLKREGFYTKNPLPVPYISYRRPINTTSVEISWTCDKKPNVTIDGFIISYMSASSAADYMKATADGENATSYTITHLAPDTVYDIKMQSYNTFGASDFSLIVKCKTHKPPTEPPPTTPPYKTNTSEGDTRVYVFIGLGVGTVALILSAIVCFITCKWKQSKEADKSRGERTDKPAVEEINHHIQAEPNDFDYVVNPKSRSNGCALPGNRITITANPLADADNKSQNMIEMSCLSNNNCSTPSASTDDGEAAAPRAISVATSTSNGGVAKGGGGKHKKSREHRRRKQHHNILEGPQGPPPIENYV